MLPYSILLCTLLVRYSPYTPRKGLDQLYSTGPSNHVFRHQRPAEEHDHERNIAAFHPSAFIFSFSPWGQANGVLTFQLCGQSALQGVRAQRARAWSW